MHGAGEQQQRYRYTARNDELHQQPTTSSQKVARTMHQGQSIQASLMCTPTTTSTSSASASSSGSSNSSGSIRSQTSFVRMGLPIKIGNKILEPAGTLVFSQTEAPKWPIGQRVYLHGNKQAVVKANLFPIGTAPPPVLSMQPQTNGSWYMSQPSTTVSLTNNTQPSTSSVTPDSGIQSIPTSPPSPSYRSINDREAYTVEDDLDDEEADYTDMPRLKPVDEDDDCYDIQSTSAGNLTSELNAPITTIPSTSSTPVPPKEEMGMNDDESFKLATMDTDEIVQRLITLDPDKAKTIAMLIKKRSAEDSKKKKDMEAEVSSTTPTTPRSRGKRTRNNKCAARSTNSPDVTTSNLPEEPSTSSMGMTEDSEDAEKNEGKRRGRRPKKRKLNYFKDEEETDSKKSKTDEPEVNNHHYDAATASLEPSCSSRPESTIPLTVDPIQFRLKVREMMERQLELLTQKMSNDMTELRLSHTASSKMVNGERGKRKESFLRQLNEQSKKLKKVGAPVRKKMRIFMTEAESSQDLKAFIKKEVKEEIAPPPKVRSRLLPRRTRDSPDVVCLSTVEERFNGEYYEITKSIPSSDDIISLWKAPSLSCGCIKGACTSDMECLNRALRVQCNSECALSYCSNRRFWKEDCGNKLCVSNGPRTKRVLKTKVARRAGEFLCEYAGEVIPSGKALDVFLQNQDARMIAIGSQLFIDATNRGNIARFIKHSCKPNSRLEIWSVNGFYRAGVFALSDLSANVEITVDKSSFLPLDVPCNCGVSECKKFIKGVRLTAESETEKTTSRQFLQRNKRSSIKRSRHTGLPTILFSPPTDESSSLILKMKKTLAAFAYRIKKVDGTMPRSMLQFYSPIVKYLKIESSNANPSDFISLIRKWLDAIDDDDVERAFVAIESHYMSSSLLLSAQQSKKAKENAPRARALSTSCHSPVLSKRGDADLSYLESLFPIGSYDPDDAWETYRANPSDNAVRCICGALDEDGGMVQCDKCHFWLHIDCCEYSVKNEEKEPKTVSDEKEYICDFCLGTQSGQRPFADVKLPDQPEVRFENCDYYRSLMNRRGIQVRLNETVYVNRLLPEDHKVMLRNLREEKKGSKHKDPNKYNFPDAPTDPLPVQKVDRKNARIFRVERLFVCPGNNRFVFGSFYAWPHETYADTGRVFSKKEVFATPYYETLPLDQVIGRCLVVDTATWTKGRPRVPKFKEEDIFLCEMQIGKTQRVFEKVPPKNRYPINTQPYVFTKFSHPRKVIRDFRPYDHSNQSPKPPKTPVPSSNSLVSSSSSQTSSDPLHDIKMKEVRKKNINQICDRLIKKNWNQI